MIFPKNLMYTKSHEWVCLNDDSTATIGLTDFAQSQLGELVFVNLPLVDDIIKADEVFADVESIKAVNDVYSPISGTVCEVNEELLDSPEKINQAPYDAWFVKVSEVGDKTELMNAAAYQKFCEEEAENH